MRSVCGGGAPLACEELARVQLQIEDNSRRLNELSVPTDALERQLDGVCEVLMEPDKYVYVRYKNRIRLDQMNVIRTRDCMQPAEELEFHIAHIPARPAQIRGNSAYPVCTHGTAAGRVAFR